MNGLYSSNNRTTNHFFFIYRISTIPHHSKKYHDMVVCRRSHASLTGLIVDE